AWRPFPKSCWEIREGELVLLLPQRHSQASSVVNVKTLAMPVAPEEDVHGRLGLQTYTLELRAGLPDRSTTAGGDCCQFVGHRPDSPLRLGLGSNEWTLTQIRG